MKLVEYLLSMKVCLGPPEGTSVLTSLPPTSQLREAVSNLDFSRWVLGEPGRLLR